MVSILIAKGGYIMSVNQVNDFCVHEDTEFLEYEGESFTQYSEECPFCGGTWVVTPSFMPYGCPHCGAT